MFLMLGVRNKENIRLNVKATIKVRMGHSIYHFIIHFLKSIKNKVLQYESSFDKTYTSMQEHCIFVPLFAIEITYMTCQNS